MMSESERIHQTAIGGHCFLAQFYVTSISSISASAYQFFTPRKHFNLPVTLDIFFTP